VYVHSNLILADKLQDLMYVEGNVPWSHLPQKDDTSDSDLESHE